RQENAMKRVVILILASSALAACDHSHLWASYGKATREALANQVIDPKAGDSAKADQGLDPEEAAIVSETYRKSLAPPKEKESAAERPIILMNDKDAKRSESR